MRLLCWLFRHDWTKYPRVATENVRCARCNEPVLPGRFTTMRRTGR